MHVLNKKTKMQIYILIIAAAAYLFFRVLLFPPVDNFFRFLIHKTVESDFINLCSFSIGEDENRRTVVCLQESIYQ